MKPKPSDIVLPYAGYVEHSESETLGLGAKPRVRSARAVGSVGEPTANKPFFTWLSTPGRCPYCSTATTLAESKRSHHYGSNVNDGWFAKAQAIQCDRCGWWLFQRHGDTRTMYHQSLGISSYQGIVYEFDITELERPVTELRRALARQEAALTSISPKELEVVVGSVFRDFLRCKVKHVGGPGDGGIDLLLLESEKPVLVQVKRRSAPNTRESVVVIRGLLGTMVLEHANRGIVVTTASDFSRPARLAVVKAREVCGLHVDLYNQERLREVLQLTEPPEPPWSVLGEEAIIPRGDQD